MLRPGLAILTVLLSLLLASACATPCEELAERRCACEPTVSERNACENRAEQQRSRHPPSDADEERCERLLRTCDCARLRTAQGKRDCGLAE
jgi:hypothetical protein